MKNLTILKSVLPGIVVLFLLETAPAATHPGFLLNAGEIEQIKQRMPEVFETFMSYYEKTRTGQRDLYF